MRHTAILASMLVLATPLLASAASTIDDGIVILSVTPRDPAVKGEILLTPAKKPDIAAGARETAENGGVAPQPARTAQAAQGARPPSR